MKTTTVPVAPPKWLIIDAKGKTLGKVAVKAAMLIRGKHKASFSPHQLCGDHVIVVNAKDIAIPPKKDLRKVYHRHTGYPGNMKIMNLGEAMRRKPTFAIENAVKGMLEANRLRTKMLKRLHVFADDKHPYEAQQPQSVSLSRS